MKAPTALLALTLGGLLQAQAPLNPAPEKVEELHKYEAVTQHSITIGGQKIGYKAIASHMPIRNEAGELQGEMFFVAYIKDGEDPKTRPLTFAYNGGPGSASLWLHVGTIGPRRVAMNEDGSMPKPPYHVVDNEETWLPSTDIVMVDAMGTGYSRLAKPEMSKQFFGVQADIRAFAEFVRAFLTRYGRFSSPIYLAGESYGGIRTAGLSNALLNNGIALNGAIIISGTMNFGTLDAARGNDLPYVGFLPTLATTAWYHRKLSPRLQKMTVEQVAAEAEAFAGGEYASALMKGTDLAPEEEARIAKRVSELTGIKESFVRAAHLRVSDWRFYKELLRESGQTVGRLDSRLKGTDAVEVGDGPDYDPSSSAIGPVFYASICDYLSNELNYKTEAKYRMWNTDGGEWEQDQGAITDTTEALRQAMVQNPHMKLMMVYGWYDLACPFYAAKYSLRHMDLKRQALDRISWQYYTAGHMMYIEAASRIKLAKDVAAFIGGSK
ncbi:MAG: peptidase S10 [Armatimonadetes bacterium]|nr:peptidase S10 [Armatimonadota bacterium]